MWEKALAQAHGSKVSRLAIKWASNPAVTQAVVVPRPPLKGHE
jgi:hypothetical protein